MRYRDKLEASGLKFSGVSPDGLLPEIVEIPEHPWFIGVQFHPELKSRPFDPHPLFASFILAALNQTGNHPALHNRHKATAYGLDLWQFRHKTCPVLVLCWLIHLGMSGTMVRRQVSRYCARYE